MNISLRFWSLALGVASLVVPAAFFGYQQYALSKWAVQQGGLVCGMPVLAAALLAFLVSALLSASAVSIGIAAARRAKRQHHWNRRMELLGLSVPLVVGIYVWSFTLWR